MWSTYGFYQFKMHMLEMKKNIKKNIFVLLTTNNVDSIVCMIMSKSTPENLNEIKSSQSWHSHGTFFFSILISFPTSTVLFQPLSPG